MKKLLTGLAMALAMAGACATARAALITTNTYVAGTNNIWTNAVATFVLKAGGTVGNLVVNSNLTANAQMGFAGFTTANLPTGVAVGYQTYCTDCLTPWGTGDRVEWDGSVWRTLRARIQATTSLVDYMKYAASVGFVGTTPYDYSVAAIGSTFGAGPQRLGASTGMSGGADAIGSTTYGPYGALATVATAPGEYRGYGGPVVVPTTGKAASFSAHLAFGNAVTDAERYCALWGFYDTTSTTNLPTRGAFVLGDPFLVFPGNTITGTATNNWILVTGQASSFTFSDTGKPITVSITSADRLKIDWFSSSVICYTNSAAAVTNTTTLPTSDCYFGGKIYHSVGSSTRILYYWYPRFHIRSATPILFF